MSSVDARALRAARHTRLLATRHDLVAVGISTRTIDRRVAAGVWRKRGRWTYELAPAPWTWMRRVTLALLESGSGAALSHVTAAALLGMWHSDEPRPIHVVVPRGSEGLSMRGVITHTTTVPFAQIRPRGLRATPAARTLRDLAATETVEDTAFALRAALRQRVTGESAILEEVAAGGPGSARLGAALALDRALALRTESWLEDSAIPALTRTNLPPFVTQHLVRTAIGGLRLDVAWPEAKVGLEWQGLLWHGNPTRVVRDSARDDALDAVGWHVEYAGAEALRGPAFDRLVQRMHRLIEDRT